MQLGRQAEREARHTTDGSEVHTNCLRCAYGWSTTLAPCFYGVISKMVPSLLASPPYSATPKIFPWPSSTRL